MNAKRWLLAALLLAPWQSGYSQSIHRCLGVHGEPVFSDRPCNAGHSPNTTASSLGHVETAPALVRGRCAASTTELRDLVIAAMQARDSIAFSGLILWHPSDPEATRTRLRGLATLIQESLQSAELESAMDSQELPSGAAHWLLLRTLHNAERVPQMAETRYALINHDGCWWLAQ